MATERLLHGEIFEITADGSLATCTVVNRMDITAEVGAQCARQMREYLISHVLRRHGRFRGVVFDVRQGPPAFGPKTRAELEQIFDAAQSSGRRAAVLVGESATQRMQFTSLCRECAPEQARVFDDMGQAEAWVRATLSSRAPSAS